MRSVELRAISTSLKVLGKPDTQMNKQQTHAETSVGIVCTILCILKFPRFSKTRMKHNASYNIISQNIEAKDTSLLDGKFNDKE